MMPTYKKLDHRCHPTDLSDLMITVAMETPRSCVPPQPDAVRLGALSHSLDLLDICRTQRRVAALLGVHSPRGGLGVVSRPQKRCRICREKMADGSRHRHAFTYAESEKLDDDTSENLIDRYLTFSESNKVIISTERTVRQDSGEILPYLSERTITMSSNASRSEDLVLPAIDGHGPENENYEDDSGSSGVEEYFMFSDDSEVKRSALIRDTVKNGKPKPTTIFTDLTGLGPWEEEEEEEEVTVYEDLYQGDEVSNEDSKEKVDESVKQCGSRESGGSRQSVKATGGKDSITRTSSGGHLFYKDSTTLTTGRRSKTNVSLQIAIWCECVAGDITQNECRECFTKGGHERWCRSQTGLCPDCGKPIKGLYREQTRSSHSMRKSPTKVRTDLTLLSHKSGLCSAHSRSGNQTSSESTSLLKPERNNIRRKSTSSSTSRLSARRPVKEGSMIRSKRYCRVVPGVNPSLPSFDPDIHRNAYSLAVSTSKAYKVKSDPWNIQNNSHSHYFSYFPLWRNPASLPEAEGDAGVNKSEAAPKIGLRRPEGKPKVKEPMKHILGSLKLGDFYPNGKMFPKTVEVKDKDVQ